MYNNDVSMVNSIFGCILLIMSMVGYILTQRRFGERWIAWLLMAVGWGLFSIAQASLITEEGFALPLLVLLWLCSFIMIMASIVLLFFKMIYLKMNK
jgi:hypothetical protein